MPGYLANGYDFYVDGTFEEHFSQYVLLDKNRYNKEAFLFEISAPSDIEYVHKKFNVAFVLDESGSVSYGNFSTMKTQCRTLVEKFVEEDRVAVFTFDDRIRKISSFTDIESAKDILCSLEQHNGNTAVYDAINEAVNEFVEASGEETTKIMVLLTDGYNNSSRVTLETAIQNALDNNVVIYCIGIGSVNTSELSSISSRTGGTYYGLNSFSQLESAFNRLIIETDLYKDSDNDGLSDYHEKKIASGEMCTGTGGSLKYCSTMNYLCADSDGDEVEIRENTQGNYRCFLYSNPCLTDTDLDGFDDFLEDYIGTSPFSGRNELAASGGFYINVFEYWKELLKEHPWNYIHNLVQADIKERYPGIELEHSISYRRRIDIFKESTLEIWEVKPASYSVEPRLSKGLAQLNEYREALKGSRIGGALIKGTTITIGDYKIEYKNLNNGLIVYNFKKNKKQEQEQEQTQQQTVTIKEKGYVYEPKTKPIDVGFYAKVVGIAIIGATLIEDVITLGAGTADDPASFGFAFTLIFGS